MRSSRTLVLCATILSVLPGAASSQTLIVKPQRSLVDQPLSIQVTGLGPGQPAIIRASMADADGRLWQSHAGFLADGRGVIDVGRQAPENGDYSGVNPMGLIHSMNLPLNLRPGGRFRYEVAQPLVAKFGLEVGGVEVQAVEITRFYGWPEVRATSVGEGGLVGRLFKPAGNGPYPGIVVLGGSEGGLSSEGDAALLASHGYATLALAYFGLEGLPQVLAEIPLEYFERAIDWLRSQPFVTEVALVGTSKGAEAALLVAARHPHVRAVVAYVPSSVVWSCICDEPSISSWSTDGTPLPFVPFQADPTYQPPAAFPIRPVVNYAYRLRNESAVQQAAIPVERIGGPVLLVSGKDDQLWPSYVMGEMIVERLQRHDHPFDAVHLGYDGAGHAIGKAYLPTAGSTTAARGRLILGGRAAANGHAQADSWPQVLEFLERALTR